MLSITRRRCLILFIMLLLVHLMACNVLAVSDIDDLNEELENQNTRETPGNNLWLEFFKLIIVLVVIIGAAWSLIRLFGKQLSSKTQGTWINVVDEVMLGQNRGIVLCEIGGKVYALAVTDHTINLLFEVDDPKLLEDISQGGLEFKPTNSNNNIMLIKKRLADFFPSGNMTENKTKGFHSMMEQQLMRLKNNNESCQKPSRRSDDNAR